MTTIMPAFSFRMESYNYLMNVDGHDYSKHTLSEVLRCLLLSVLLIPIINLSILIKQEKGTFLMCVVFLCITVTHGNDGNPLAFGMARIIDTTVGIVIALVINQFSLCRSKEPSHME